MVGLPRLIVALSSNYAYVADWNSGLQIIDISDPSNPTFKGYCVLLGVSQISVSGNYVYVAYELGGLQIIALSLDKLTLSGTTSSIKTYTVDIKARNEAGECIIDSFDIIVNDSDDTTDDTTDTTDTTDTLDIVDTTDTTDTISVTGTTDLTNSIAIISSMTVAACVASFSFPLIIGVVNEDNTKEKELKKIKELQKLETSDDKKIVVKEKLLQPVDE
jgi:hypothetical protein